MPTTQCADDIEYETAVAYVATHQSEWIGAECAYSTDEMTILVTGERQAMNEPMKALDRHIAEEAWEGSLELRQKLLTPDEEVVREAECLLEGAS
ncbi:hypothetical protein [Streptomyces sp. NPDC058254]|uniref:hypothetical protein n=1 Tax=Streptomyces sp. NPDC058254 TaxID=3346406 RepID=UPI0036E4D110